ncbi:MAG: hypothetical protein FWD71_08075 [Oscillospiraceae bacterium]|nr:hypothetical protein [Oscillospiraceae bacterium]
MNETKKEKKFFNSKKKLLLALLAVLLVASCIGATTFAWFTAQTQGVTGSDFLAANVGVKVASSDFDASALVDDKSYFDSTLFETYLVPGRIVGTEMAITNDSNITAVVKIPMANLCTFVAPYASDLDGKTYADYLDLITADAGFKNGTDAIFDDSTWVAAGATDTLLEDSLQIGVYDGTNIVSFEDALDAAITAGDITAYTQGTSGDYYVVMPTKAVLTLDFVVGIPGLDDSQAPLEDFQVNFGDSATFVQAVQATINAVVSVWNGDVGDATFGGVITEK